MNTLLRNFFYAIGLTILFALHGLDASNAQFADMVRLVQSPIALQLVLAITAVLVGLDLFMGQGGHRAGSAQAASGNARGSWAEAHRQPSPDGGDVITYKKAD